MSLPRIAVLAAALALASGSIATEATFEDALAAFDEASASKQKEHAGYVTAYEIWSRLAEEGDPASRYHLGILHMYGLGGAKFDQYLAVDYVQSAAEADYHTAQSLMGFLSESGAAYVMMEDAAAAAKWYTKGAEGGHCVSVRRLARAYREGELGLDVDAEKAEYWETRIPSCAKR